MSSSDSISSALPLEPWAITLINTQIKCEKNYPQGFNKKTSIDPQTKLSNEVKKEKTIIQKACQIKNPHPYGTTTLGGNLSDPTYPDDFRLVGSSKTAKTIYCNSFSREKGKTIGCLETHKHTSKFLESHIYHTKQLDGRCLPNQAVIKPQTYHCSDPECPYCALHWAGQITAKAVRRIETFLDLTVNSFNIQFNNKTKAKGKSKPFIFSLSKTSYDLPFSSLMEIRHLTVSIPKIDWLLPYNVKKKKAETSLFMAGAEGACQFYHPKRWSKTNKKWFYSPHFHFLAVVPGGWLNGQIVSIVNKGLRDKNGEFSKDKKGNSLFEGSNYVIKNLPENRTKQSEQIKTLMYQLSHAGVPFGHQHAVTWIGCLSYNQLSVPKITKSKINEVKEHCPLCNSPLRPVAYNNKTFLTDPITKTFILDKDGQKIPIWNKHPILKPKYDGKFCIVALDSWEYISRDGQKYDPKTKTWSQQIRKKDLDDPGGEYFDEY
jgi:hypothetical protein